MCIRRIRIEADNVMSHAYSGIIKTFDGGERLPFRRRIDHRQETPLTGWEGIADPKAIDTAVKASLGLRMPVVGVVQRYDFTGLDASLMFLQNPSIELVNEDKIPKRLENSVKSGNLGVKSGKGFFDYGDRPLKEIIFERDRRMLALKRFLKEKDISYPMT